MKKAVNQSFQEMGVRPGDAVLIHTGFRAFGFPGTAQQRAAQALGLWQAIQHFLTPHGSLLVPALSHEYVGYYNPVFHELATRSCVGYLAELFRTECSEKRSLCPTHSVCGWGSHLDYYLGSHQQDHSPAGPSSPYSLLRDPKEGQRSWIIFLGCSPRSNTSMHGVEELLEPDYLFDGTMDCLVIDRNDGVIHTNIKLHGFRAMEQRYDRLLTILPPKYVRTARLFMADCYALPVQQVWNYGYKALERDPWFFVQPRG